MKLENHNILNSKNHFRSLSCQLVRKTFRGSSHSKSYKTFIGADHGRGSINQGIAWEHNSMDGGRNVPLHQKVSQVLHNSLWSSTSADEQQQKETVNKALNLLLFKSTPNDVSVNMMNLLLHWVFCMTIRVKVSVCITELSIRGSDDLPYMKLEH